MPKKTKVQRKRLVEDTDEQALAAFLAEREARTEALDQHEAEETGRRPRGRPSTYQDSYARMARIICSKGGTDADLSEAFSVSITQIQHWQTMHPEFGAAVRYGKAEVFDPKVERALAQRALGYTIDCEEVKVNKDGDVIRYPIRKHFPPDVTACIFWLKNRQPKKWRDVWKIDHSGKVSTEGLTAEQILNEIRQEAATLGLSLPKQTTNSTVGVATFPKPNGSNGTKH